MTSAAALTPAAGLASWLDELLAEGTLPKGRALILGADMIEEIAMLAARGFPVRVVDARSDALARVRRETTGDVQTLHADFLSMSPALAGAVDIVVERSLLPSLDPVRRGDWAHGVGRVLPPGGLLAGLFTIGVDTGAPPRAVLEDALTMLLGRLFVPVSLTLVETPLAGRPRAMRGVFRRK